ncbi:uncharacterized protein LOC118763557 [Octopus sinensis]|uniref:Uncharacterized protein LOC118763557 n=1 Tax=Octopus sinensis TaxID=2607531 RepID=A0A7E6ETM4_9MOLL|nr:uncharacterized protein LOC118763557 [Octopus sinensis]
MAVMQMVTAPLLSVILIISLTSLNTYAKEHRNNCTTEISPTVIKNLTRLVRSGKQVFNFEVHIIDKKIDGLLNPVPLDYFANARRFTWIPDKPDGLVMYKNVLFDFSIRSFNILDAYIATPSIDIDMNCGKQNVQRYDVIYSIFEELKRIVFINESQMGESGYMCFFINLSHDMQKNSPYTLLAYRILGIYREILKNYCCELHKNDNTTYEPKSICSGNTIENSMFVNCANVVGAVLLAIFPLYIRFISKAKLPPYSCNQPQSGNEEVHLETLLSSPNSNEPNQQPSTNEELNSRNEDTSPNSLEPNQQQSTNERLNSQNEDTSPNSLEPNQQQLPNNEYLSIAMLAKPDIVGGIWFVAMFFVHAFTVMNALQEHYKGILVQSIKFTKIIKPNLVQLKYEEEYIDAKLFEAIVNEYFPLSYEIGKAIIKLILIVSFFFACNNIINRKDLHLSAFARIALILMTSLMPKILSKMNAKFHFDTSLSHKVIHTIYELPKGNESN